MGEYMLEPYQNNGHWVWKKTGGQKMFLYVNDVNNHWVVGAEVGPFQGQVWHPAHSWSELENSYKTTVNAEVWCFKRIFRKSKQYQIIKIIQQAVFYIFIFVIIFIIIIIFQT